MNRARRPRPAVAFLFGSAFVVGLLILFTTAPASAQSLPAGSLDLFGQGYVLGGTDRSTTSFGSLSLRGIQTLRVEGQIRSEIIVSESNGHFSLARFLVGLYDYRLGDDLATFEAGDVIRTFSLFSDAPNFAPLQYVYFRGTSTTLRPRTPKDVPPPWIVSAFGGRVSGSPFLSVGSGGFHGDATFAGLYGELRTFPHIPLSLGLTHVVFDEDKSPARTNVQAQGAFPVFTGVTLLAEAGEALYSGARGFKASSFRIGPSIERGIYSAELYARQSGPDFLDVPGKIVSERDSRGVVAIFRMRPRRLPALYVGALAQETNIDDDTARPETNQESATIQIQNPIPRGLLVLRADGTRFDVKAFGGNPESSGTSQALGVDWNFGLGAAMTGTLTTEYRRQSAMPVQPNNDFRSAAVEGRFQGFRLGLASFFANLRVERRFPLESGEANWQWSASLGGYRKFKDTSLSVQLGYNSAPTSFFTPDQRNDRAFASVDVARTIVKSLGVVLGGSYQESVRTPEGARKGNDWQIRLTLVDRLTWGHTPKVRPGAEPGAPPPRGTVAGRVFIDENEDGALDAGDTRLAGIGVRLGQLDLVRTDASGQFLFTEVPDGAYRLSIVLRTLSASFDAVSRSFEVVIKDGGMVKTDFRVVRVGIVRGRVVERTTAEGAETLVPKENATVRLETGGKELRTTTDERGAYSFESVPPGPYAVELDVESLPDRAEIREPIRYAGVMTKGEELKGKDFVFEMARIPEEIVRFPEAPPRSAAETPAVGLIRSPEWRGRAAYAVYAGAFSSRQEAERAGARFEAVGYKVNVFSIETGAGVRYRLLVGEFRKLAEAVEAWRRLKEKFPEVGALYKLLPFEEARPRSESPGGSPKRRR